MQLRMASHRAKRARCRTEQREMAVGQRSEKADSMTHLENLFKSEI